MVCAIDTHDRLHVFRSPPLYIASVKLLYVLYCFILICFDMLLVCYVKLQILNQNKISYHRFPCYFVHKTDLTYSVMDVFNPFNRRFK